MKKTKKSKVEKSTQAPSAWIPGYSITLTIGDQILKGEGKTAIDALQSIPKPLKIMNKGTFFMTDGVKKTSEVLMFPIRLRRLFWKGSQAVQLKILCSAMK